MSNELQAQVINEVHRLVAKAKALYNHPLTVPTITFDLKGTTAGYARYKAWQVRYHPTFLKENPEKYMARTVPHEVAHLVAKAVFNEPGHGYSWQRVMLDLGVSDITRCHSYSTTNVVTKTQKLHACKCGCKTHQVKTSKFNAIKAGGRNVTRNGRKTFVKYTYSCIYCKQVLTPGVFVK